MERDNTPETGTVKDEFNNPDILLKQAKQCVIKVHEESGQPYDQLTENDIYIVWFSKTLQNWKALLSTDLHDGLYYEVTYNGDRKTAYVDVYKKQRNVEIVTPVFWS